MSSEEETPSVSTDYSDEEDETSSSEEGPREAERLSLVRSFFAKADPADVTVISEELEPVFSKAVDKYYKEKDAGSDDLQYGPHVIWPVQYVIAHTFMRTQGVTSLLAATGFGKSLTGIAASLLADVCLILVPNAVMTVWINLFEKYGLYDVRKPGESSVLVYSTTPNSHRTYFETVSESALAKRKNLIVLCSHIHLADSSSLPGVMSAVFTKTVVKGRDFTVIVDEAHERIPAIAVWVQPRIGRDITRELLMSGSELTPKIVKMNGYSINHTIQVVGSNDMPNDTWDIRLLESASYRENEKEWAEEVKKIASTSKRLVIFSEVDARTLLIKKKVFGKKTVYKYTTNQKNTIENFNKDPNAVLFVPRTKVTGISVNADSLIILNPGDATTERLIQTTKRIMRPDNPFRDVTIYLLCGIPKDYYRGMYAKAFSLLSWPFGRVPVVNTSMVYKAIASIRMLGLNHETVDRVDLCVFFADYAELQHTKRMIHPLAEILAWWNENKLETTVLTEEIIGNLVLLDD